MVTDTGYLYKLNNQIVLRDPLIGVDINEQKSLVVADTHTDRVQFADGSSRVMPFLGDELGALTAIRQFRIIQQADLGLELQVVMQSTLTESDTSRVRQIFRDNGLGALPLTINTVARIDWPAGRKREEFRPLE